MQNGNVFVSELSTTRHSFKNYHFCRGNSNKRKTRLGIILKGSGTYIYLGKRLKVVAGDVVFIPENIYCYSEWRGEPDIEVVYVSSFIHYGGFEFEPQCVLCDGETKEMILKVSELLSTENFTDSLEAYSLLYRVLKVILPQMKESSLAYDKTLQSAVEYITSNWNNNFSVGDVAKHCLVSESTLYHLFSSELGQTPVHFLKSIRINIAIEYLENTGYSVSEISRMVCFNSENHFRRVFGEFTGTTPLKFKKSRK